MHADKTKPRHCEELDDAAVQLRHKAGQLSVLKNLWIVTPAARKDRMILSACISVYLRLNRFWFYQYK